MLCFLFNKFYGEAILITYIQLNISVGTHNQWVFQCKCLIVATHVICLAQRVIQISLIDCSLLRT